MPFRSQEHIPLENQFSLVFSNTIMSCSYKRIRQWYILFFQFCNCFMHLDVFDHKHFNIDNHLRLLLNSSYHYCYIKSTIMFNIPTTAKLKLCDLVTHFVIVYYHINIAVLFGDSLYVC